jgi:hypothetical protein
MTAERVGQPQPGDTTSNGPAPPTQHSQAWPPNPHHPVEDLEHQVDQKSQPQGPSNDPIPQGPSDNPSTREWEAVGRGMIQGLAQEYERETRTRTTLFTSVRWGITVSTGNYSSARLDAECLVGPDDDPEQTLRELKLWVGLHAPAAIQQMEEAERDYQRVRRESEQLAGLIAEARHSWDSIVRVFERLGIPVPRDVQEELPF